MVADYPTLSSVDGCSEVPNGADLLVEVREAIRRYCVLPGEHELIAVVLWCALTHLLAEFDYAPRLVIRSAEKRSGKSRLLEIIDGLVYSPLRAVNATVAYVFRSLGVCPPPTLLFDEADTIFGSKSVADKNEELRGLLNAGFQRGLNFGRVVGSDLATGEFPTFAMAALAGIGRMPETIEDRAVVVIMKRRRDEETVQPYRTRRDGPVLQGLRDRLAVWADTVRERAGALYPELPVDDRAADLWEPLVSVADLAGGAWPKLARDAAVALVSSAAEDDTTRSPALQLLADIRTVFDTRFMKSEALCCKLRALSESPWEQHELNPSRLGIRLCEYSIKARHSPDKKERGYYLADFSDAFARYLPDKVSEVVPPVQGTQCPAQQADTVDTLGRLTDSQATRPNPTTMPQRLKETAVVIAKPPRRQRRRTRGRGASRPRG
ncbi:hypothetical protein DE4585_02842 [Mycobacteroides salmoniphilum]|uniref:DUF3631 domain-containing protein n=1 Tax=Mycobacteroides salmoniphilum TaxID=404941 RepID=A0A4R8RWY9_9MYCO|nr:DUF3631 domain-containing protein [Mycobacteroides salmoniphilum]TDZ79107.1 hypothetical protein DE4585_02842 [Mycobacteroides salmoniphilum]